MTKQGPETDPARLKKMSCAELCAVGEAYFKKGRWHEAACCLREALAELPANAALHYLLGRALANLDQHRGAASHLAQAVTLDPKLTDALLHLAASQQKIGCHHEALAHLAKLLASRPDHAEAHFFRGVSLNALRDREGALAAYRQAFLLMPGFYQALFNMGTLYQQAGNLPSAAACFERVLTLAPDCAEGYAALGDLSFRKGELPAAIAHYEHALALNPTALFPRYYLGLTLHAQGNSLAGLKQINAVLSQAAPSWGPTRVRIEPSSVCNLRCQHCPTGVSYGKVERTVMEPALFECILTQLRRNANFTECVLYLGGEPLLNKQLPLMIRRLRAETTVSRILFNTNGMLLHEPLCRELAEAGVDQIEISIDGRTAEENNRIRRGADYAKVRDHIRLLARFLPTERITIANTVVKRPGDPDRPTTPSFLAEDFPGLAIQSTYAMKWPGLEVEHSLLAEASPTLQSPPCYCKKPFTEVAIRANGDVVPCCFDLGSELVLGNIKEQDLLDIWHGAAYRQLRDTVLRNETAALPALCRKCPIYAAGA